MQILKPLKACYLFNVSVMDKIIAPIQDVAQKWLPTSVATKDSDAQVEYTDQQKQAICLSYLIHAGEMIPKHLITPKEILKLIRKYIARTPTLCHEGQSDWEVVWGPCLYTYPTAVYQDNGMMVLRQKSQPDNYMVSVRGTNFLALQSWFLEGLNVFVMRHWEMADDKVKISDTTNIGFEILQKQLIPAAGMPGEGDSLQSFLSRLREQGKANLCFTGHSLGGTLAPTLALWYKEHQGQPDSWDPQAEMNVTCIAFAGATGGNKVFAEYSQKVLGDDCLRMYNSNDMVPNAWSYDDMKHISTLYKGVGIYLNPITSAFFFWTNQWLRGYQYTQLSPTQAFAYPVDRNHGNLFVQQAIFQHVDAYPIEMLGELAGKQLLDMLLPKVRLTVDLSPRQVGREVAI